MKKAILFGSIGTLIETSNIQRESFNEAFKETGLDWYWDEEDYKKLLKKSGGINRIENFAEKNNTQVDAKKIRERKTEIYNTKIQTTLIEPREGVLEIIEYAHVNKIKIGFVTSTTTNNINSVFKTLNGKVTKKDFDFIGNQNLVEKLKPHPDIYFEALKFLEINSAECIAIEDSVESALSANSAKIECIAFPGVFHKEGDFSFCRKIINKLDVTLLN
ncbi:HAD hydrolase-like protein [Alphaproteobacteria bacterium]|nr:HAD hydrolase-like protein [Alphaproteobacteria bacterium]